MVRMTADRERGIPARDVTWSSVPPPRGRRGRENMPTKAKALSQVPGIKGSFAIVNNLFTQSLDLWSLKIENENFSDLIR